MNQRTIAISSLFFCLAAAAPYRLWAKGCAPVAGQDGTGIACSYCTRGGSAVCVSNGCTWGGASCMDLSSERNSGSAAASSQGGGPTNPCASVRCSPGYYCSGGQCLKRDIKGLNGKAKKLDSCANVRCMHGYTCRGGTCYPQQGGPSGDGSCANIMSCAPGYSCRNGACYPVKGKSGATDNARLNPSCANVRCVPGTKCSNGQCISSISSTIIGTQAPSSKDSVSPPSGASPSSGGTSAGGPGTSIPPTSGSTINPTPIGGSGSPIPTTGGPGGTPVSD